MVNLLEYAGVFLVLAGLVMYAVSGGADFGGGVWTALASGPRAEEQRKSLYRAIGPVWETNHIWLIILIVVLFTCFSAAFKIISIALVVPLAIALIGINFRGAAFVFRHFGKSRGTELPATGIVFSIASAFTPFFLGMAVSAISAGAIKLVNGQIESGLWSAWASTPVLPFTVTGGLIGLSICAYITPVYMAARTTGELREDFRKRAIAGAFALGGLTALEIIISGFFAPLFFKGFLHPLPLVLAGLAVVCGVITQVLLFKRSFQSAQWVARTTIGFTITGFMAAVYPYILIGQMTFAQAMSNPETFKAVLITLPIGVALLVPSLIFLYKSFKEDIGGI